MEHRNDERPSTVSDSKEAERLLNPAYCASILAECASGYSSTLDGDGRCGISINFVFICLPLVLHYSTCSEILKHNRNYSLHRLIKRNPELLVGLNDRMRALLPISKRAIIFGTAYGMLNLERTHFTVGACDDFVKRLDKHPLGECARHPLKAAKLLGIWLSRHSISDVYTFLGIDYLEVIQ